MSRRLRFGFTLFELSIVLVVLSLMLGGILAALTQDSRISKKEELTMKMKAIEQAIIAYTKRSDAYALPCPADPTLQITDADFGVAESASGCPAPADDYRRGSETTTGSVPVKTIGLPDNYAIDPWGNQFSYTVDREAATTNAFVNDSIYTSTIGDINVLDLDGNLITTTAVMVLLSYGPNKFGGFGSDGVRKDIDSNNTFEWENCNCSATGDADAGGADYNEIFATGINAQDIMDEENNFDDIVHYYERNFFRLSSDLVL